MSLPIGGFGRIAQTKAPLLEWFGTCSSPNQKELIGLLRAMLAVRPDRSPASLNLLLELMRWVKQHSLHMKFADETGIVLPHFDWTLMCSWQQCKKEKVTPAEWWQMYGSIGGMVVDEAAMQKLLECTTNWEDCADALNRLCDTRVGHGMFAWAQQHVTASTLGRPMDDAMLKLSMCDPLAAKEIDDAKKRITESSAKLPGISGLPSRQAL